MAIELILPVVRRPNCKLLLYNTQRARRTVWEPRRPIWNEMAPQKSGEKTDAKNNRSVIDSVRDVCHGIVMILQSHCKIIDEAFEQYEFFWPLFRLSVVGKSLLVYRVFVGGKWTFWYFVVFGMYVIKSDNVIWCKWITFEIHSFSDYCENLCT